MDQTVDPARLRKPRGQGASRRGEILAAAKHLFAEQGVDHVTMRRIGAVVGVSPTALYMHFADKDALLAAIAQDTFGELLDRLEASQSSDRSPLANFRAGLRAYIEFGLARPDEYRLTFMTRLFRDTGIKTCALEMADRSFAILQDRVTDLIAAGAFRAGPASLLAEAIWATLHGVTALLLDQADNLEAARGALIDTALDILEAGLVAAPRTPIG
jgi:AcrR family transcriptional regulator